jgi:hypothetical protein
LPDNNAFTADRLLQFFWFGAKYELAWGLNVTGAYYHVNQKLLHCRRRGLHRGRRQQDGLQR